MVFISGRLEPINPVDTPLFVALHYCTIEFIQDRHRCNRCNRRSCAIGMRKSDKEWLETDGDKYAQ